MPSKMVIDRLRRKNKLTSLLRKHRESTVEAVARELAPFAESDDDLATGVDALLRAVERMAAARQRELDQADVRHWDTLKSVQELRRERDEAARELRDVFVEIRETTTLLFGRRASNRMLGIQGATPRAHNPRPLLLDAQRAQGRLEDPKIRMPKPKTSLSGWDESAQRRQWSESLGTHVARLNEAIYQLELETHQTDSTRHDKGGTMSLHDQELSAIANLQEALLVLGRKPKVARTIWRGQRPDGRPARRKSGERGQQETRSGEETGTSETTTEETASATSPEVSSEEVAQT